MKQVRMIAVVAALLAVALVGSASADITLGGNEVWGVTADLTRYGITPTGSGTRAAPYVYDLGSQNLNMAGHTITTGVTAGTYPETNSLTILTAGSVTGGGTFDFTPAAGGSGGALKLSADTGISIGTVKINGTNTFSTGNITLASTGSVVLSGHILTTDRANEGAGGWTTVVTISGSRIEIQGATADGYAIKTAGGGSGFTGGGGGHVYLYTTGAVKLTTGGIYTRRLANSGCGNITINDGAGGRAGDVSIGGGLCTTGNASNGYAGNINVLANSLHVTGNIDTTTPGRKARAGSVKVDVLEDATFDGYIYAYGSYTLTDGTKNIPGKVDINGRHIEFTGVDGSGVSIRTQCLVNNTNNYDLSEYHPTDYTPGSVTLTGIDSSLLFFDPSKPLDGDTSSVYVKGQILTETRSPLRGNVTISAVAVYLGDSVLNDPLKGGIITESSASYTSTVAIHYGIIDYGITTHLVENGDQWLGGADPHYITYTNTSGTTSFTADVLYAGLAAAGGVVPEPAGLSLLGLALVVLRRRRRS